MYYDEKMINGVLCSRSTPDGKWEPFTLEELTIKYQQSAAPELLEALEELLETPNVIVVQNKARTVIAKAKGEEPK
jgi:hypothetical protein